MGTTTTRLAKEWGVEITDARDPINITVLPEDINGATMNDPCNCVFARACKRQYSATRVYIYRTTATIFYEKFGRHPARLVRYMLSASARREIRSFDETKEFTAGAFRFEVPRRSQTLGAVRVRSAKRPGRHYPGNGKTRRTVIHATSMLRINTLRMRVESGIAV